MSGIYLVAAIVLALIMPAKAQHLNQTKVIRFFNNETKEQVGTATVSGNTVYLRDRNGEHYATMVKNADGTRTLYDPAGKEIDAESLKLPLLPD